MEDEFLSFKEIMQRLKAKGILPEDYKERYPETYRQMALDYMQRRGDRVLPWEYLEFADSLSPEELEAAEELNRMAIERIKR